jgi:hypothetical protein
MKWWFPPNHGGQEHGFHDPGVETFKGNFDRFLARESIQNSIDAASSSPVTVEFTLSAVNGKEIPGSSALAARFKACGDYWTDDLKATRFFTEAQSLMNAKRIPVLKISDYSTTGVAGEDSDRKGNWYNLVRCSGSSFKAGGEGGSFGIGKNAPFAASALRTVFYSTYNYKKEHIFQGVARLVTHESPDGKETAQATGYWGSQTGNSIRKADDIPKELRRQKQGTDILIYGYLGGPNWQDDIVYSVLENFWPAIYFGELVVKVAGLEINKKTLPELIKKHRDNGELSAEFYFNAVTSPHHRLFADKLEHLGDVKLWLFAGNSTYPNKIAMARKAGMVVFCKPCRSILRFSGFFHCTNEEGNKKLRDMEPPAHNAWDPDRPERGASKQIEKELYDWIRACVRELAPHLDSKIISIPDLYRYLPDDGDTEDAMPFGEPSAEAGQSADESSNLIPKLYLKPRPIKPKRTPDRFDDDDEEEGGSFGDGEKKRGKGESQRKGQDRERGEDDPEDKPLDITFRSFLQDPKKNIYRIALKPKASCAKAKLCVRAVGDDSRAETVNIAEAFSLPGRVGLSIERPNIISGVSLDAEKTVSVEVKLIDTLRYALEVVAYEI